MSAKPPKSTPKISTPLVFSLPAYIMTIFAIALVASLIVFKLFWDSPTRDLAVQIQQAAADSLDNPFFLPIDDSNIDLEDGVLTTTELYKIQQQIIDLQANLDAQTDFAPINAELYSKFLEF